MYVYSRDGRFGYKVGHIGPKWDKSGAFSDQISVHFDDIYFPLVLILATAILLSNTTIFGLEF